jgi:uncharacterized hydrophobic protein (TIGR00341 family)
MQVFLPHDRGAKPEQLLEGREVLGSWRDEERQRTVLHLLVPAEETEPIMDQFEHRYSALDGFHVVLYPVEAVLPRPKPQSPPDASSKSDSAGGEGEKPETKRQRISREELYTAANESLGINRVFLGLTILSAVVAAVGLTRNDVAVIIGAMVIAPLLGPNVAMALATTLGDTDLLRRAFWTNLAGIGSAFVFAVAAGLMFPVHSDVPAIASRTSTGFGDVFLALAAGTAGTLAFTRGQSGAVIGVMVAVALVPPVVVCGMLLGEGYVSSAFGAFLLAAANIICINLAGVVTFLMQGVRPRSWWEAELAKKGVRKAMLIWTILLAGLLLVLWLSKFETKL